MSKKHTALPRLAIGLALTCMTVLPALAQDATVDASGGLRLRTGQSTSSSLILTMPNGATVDVLSTVDGWSQVSYRGYTGYASSQYLILGDADTTTEATTSQIIIKDGPLNIRSGPATTYQRVGTLSAGSVVETFGTENGWYKISEGYIHGDYATPYETSSTSTATTTTTTTQPEAQTNSTDDTTSSYIEVVAGPLNVRSGPDTSYSRVTTLYQGSVVECFGTENGWYKVANGYVHGDYVTASDGPTAFDATLGQQIVDYALQFVGCSYVYGGNGPTSFDCSGFTSYVFAHFGIQINRTATAQLSNGTYVSKADLQPGDAIYFSRYNDGRASHTAIYIGDGQFVHASTPSTGVIISDFDYASYYATGFMGGRRMY